MEQILTPLRITGLLAVMGAFLYAIGDVLLLAGRVNLKDYPRLQPFAKLLSDAERMVAFSPRRLIWGALMGVFATPLVLAGFWQVYQGLERAGTPLALLPIALFGTASVIGTFVHGSFYYLGEYIQALNEVEDGSQNIIAGMIERHRKVLIATYAPLLAMIVIASMLFSVLVATQETSFPRWMAAVNPVTMTIAWLLVRRALPAFIRTQTEGAGFNIAYLAFFACTTMTLWNG